MSDPKITPTLLATFKMCLRNLPDENLIGDIVFHKQSYKEALTESTYETLVDYLYRGIPTGEFLQAVLKNDLFEAIGRADIYNASSIPEICGLIYNEFPMLARDHDQWVALHNHEVENSAGSSEASDS